MHARVLSSIDASLAVGATIVDLLLDRNCREVVVELGLLLVADFLLKLLLVKDSLLRLLEGFLNA